MNVKQTVIAAGVAIASAAMHAAVPEVSGVTMVQDDERLVTITYTLSDAPAVVTLDVQTNVTGDVWASIGGRAMWNVVGDVWKRVETGNHTITWRPDHSWPDHKIAGNNTRAVVTAWALENTPDYMVVDVSAAARPNTQTYYPAADFVPGGVTNGLYKTTTFLMRKIMAKDVKWTMGSTKDENGRQDNEATHQVTLTNNYYIGVYEVTQSQWGQVATNNTRSSAYFKAEGTMRPMEQMSYNEIRNAVNSRDENASFNWPRDPNPGSFLGLLRTKTGIDFDLPAEAQWEFAARAGNGVGYWNDGSAIQNSNPDANLNLLGRYERNGGKLWNGSSYVDPDANCGVTNGTAIVGSYAPNSWGIYDMHGNVHELCLDWYEEDIAEIDGKVNIDPSAPENALTGGEGTERVWRGGSWYHKAANSRSAYRNHGEPKNYHNTIGFRIVCTAGLQ